MTRAEWHWLSVGWCVLVAVGCAAVFGRKLRWAEETLRRERFTHYLILALAGAGVGWVYYYVAVPITMASVACFLIVPAGWLVGLLLLCFVVCLPMTASMWLQAWRWENVLQPRIERRWDAERTARRIRRAELGRPQEGD